MKDEALRCLLYHRAWGNRILLIGLMQAFTVSLLGEMMYLFVSTWGLNLKRGLRLAILDLVSFNYSMCDLRVHGL